MDIQVRFEDGTTELRDAETPCLDCPTPRDLTCGLAAAQHSEPLRLCRGLHVRVWRITGGRGENESLTGEWQSCRVETEGEQIERITRERDTAEREHADTMEVLASQHALAVRLGADVSRLTRERDALAAKVDACEPFAHPDREPESTPAMAEGNVWCWASVAQDMHEGRGYPLGAAECPEVAALRHALYWAKIASFRDGDRFTVCAAWSDGHDEFEIEVSATEAPSAWGLRARIV